MAAKKQQKSLRELKTKNKKNKKEGKVIFRFDFKEIVTKGI